MKKFIEIINPKTGEIEKVDSNNIGIIDAEKAKKMGLTDNQKRKSNFVSDEYFSENDNNDISNEDYFDELKNFLKENNYSYDED